MRKLFLMTIFLFSIFYLLFSSGVVYAHEEDAEYHALPLEAKIENVFKRMAKAVTNLFSGKKLMPVGGAVPAALLEKKIQEENKFSQQTPQTEQAKPVKLTLETTSSFEGVKETDKIIFKAIAVMDDGTEQDVTAEAKWKVIGPIGVMEEPGIFLAMLDASVSEFGEGMGSVVVSWHDTATCAAFLENSPIFKVEAYYGEDLGPQEGLRQNKNFFGNLLRTIMFWKK